MEINDAKLVETFWEEDENYRWYINILSAVGNDAGMYS